MPLGAQGQACCPAASVLPPARGGGPTPGRTRPAAAPAARGDAQTKREYCPTSCKGPDVGKAGGLPGSLTEEACRGGSRTGGDKNQAPDSLGSPADSQHACTHTHTQKPTQRDANPHLSPEQGQAGCSQVGRGRGKEAETRWLAGTRAQVPSAMDTPHGCTQSQEGPGAGPPKSPLSTQYTGGKPRHRRGAPGTSPGLGGLLSSPVPWRPMPPPPAHVHQQRPGA